MKEWALKKKPGKKRRKKLRKHLKKIAELLLLKPHTLKEILMAAEKFADAVPTTDYEARKSSAEKALETAKKQRDLVGQVAERLEQAEGRLEAKSTAHVQNQEKLMAILEETNKLQDETIGILLKALGEKQTATPPVNEGGKVSGYKQV